MRREVLAAAGRLHGAGVVHGDLRSDNILVDASDPVLTPPPPPAPASGHCVGCSYHRPDCRSWKATVTLLQARPLGTVEQPTCHEFVMKL